MIPLAPLEKRPIYQGILGTIFGVSSIIGPLIGGAFTTNSHLTWRWYFYINLPISAVSVAIIFFFLHLEPPFHASFYFREKVLGMDLIGNALFLPSSVWLLLALQWAGSKYEWHDARIIALFVLSGVFFIAWVVSQIYGGKKSTVPLHILCQRSIIAGMWFSACIGGVMLLLVHLVPSN